MKSAVESAIGNLKPFKLRAEGFEAIQSHGFYLFLKKITEGQNMLKELHFKLHEKTLRPYQSPRTIDGSYMRTSLLGDSKHKRK